MHFYLPMRKAADRRISGSAAYSLRLAVSAK